ncbi:endonuclease/exonuclease/phosphatase family protein, partial [Ostertagia ostertagi]
MGSPQSTEQEKVLLSAVEQLMSDESMPPYLKTIVDYLLDAKEKIELLATENKELSAEIQKLRDENSTLRRSLSVASKPPPHIDLTNPTQVSEAVNHSSDSSCCESKEFARSLVIIGVPESSDFLVSNRLSHDWNCIRVLFNYLQIECIPLSVYRMGRPSPHRPRLLKVVLPSTKFRDEALRRAHKLKYSQFKGTYIRPSLPKAEREKLRALKQQARENSNKPGKSVNAPIACANLASSPTSVLDRSMMSESLPKNSSSLVFLLSNFCYDLAALTETWLKPVHDSSTYLGILGHEYTLVRCDRPRKAGGGVAFLVRKTLSYHIVIKEAIKDSYEILCCDFTFPELCRIVVLYRAPSCNQIKTLQLFKAITDLSICSYPFIVMGDFNLPNIEWTNDEINNVASLNGTILQLCKSYNLMQFVPTPTRGSHTLDLLFCNKVGLISEVAINSPIGSSDHAMISFSIDNPRCEHKPVFKRKYTKADYNKICSYLSD